LVLQLSRQERGSTWSAISNPSGQLTILVVNFYDTNDRSSTVHSK